MLKGSKVGLRARHDDDVAILYAELHSDVATTSRADGRPWRPVTPGSDLTPYRVDDEDETNTRFSVVDLADGTLLGSAGLWGIDPHNRTAHIGMSLRPGARGRGYAGDVLGVLCHYAFVVRGLNRLQIETLADNAPMLRAAERTGFAREGVLRSSGWVLGEFVDEVVLGLLVDEWKRAARE